jgi:Ca2+-binding EF-hand superfamily protein
MTLVNNESLTQAFKIIDKDGSGMITIDELKEAFDTQGTKKDQQLWLDIMKEVDKNNDNQISLEEFMDSMAQFLRQDVQSKLAK